MCLPWVKYSKPRCFTITSHKLLHVLHIMFHMLKHCKHDIRSVMGPNLNNTQHMLGNEARADLNTVFKWAAGSVSLKRFTTWKHSVHALTTRHWHFLHTSLTLIHIQRTQRLPCSWTNKTFNHRITLLSILWQIFISLHISICYNNQNKEMVCTLSTKGSLNCSDAQWSV